MLGSTCLRIGKRCLNRDLVQQHIISIFKFSSNTILAPPARRIIEPTCNRSLSTLNLTAAPQPEYMLTQDEISQFTSRFSDIINDLAATSHFPELEIGKKHQHEILNYNVSNRQHKIGHTVVGCYKILEAVPNQTCENIRLANILGWCTELLASSIYMRTDMMDAADTRHGMPCWYKNKAVNTRAVYDAILLESGLYGILRKNFSGLRCYSDIVNLFQDVTLNVGMGQSIDNMTMRNGKPALDLFTMSRYNAIIKYKAGYLMFKLPVGLAMYLASMSSPEIHEQADSILFKLGQFYQIHDDIINCFGDSPAHEEDGNDIRNGKCTWLIVEALHRATPAQRETLEKNYGREDAESENVVKALYKEMGLLNAYSVCNKLYFDVIQKDIHKLSDKKLQTLFRQFLEQRTSTMKQK